MPPPAASTPEDGAIPSNTRSERGRGKKRKRGGERKETLELLRETHNNINQTTLNLMKEKHKKEMETLESVNNAARDFSTMCNTVNTFFNKLLNDYDKVVLKK